MYRAAAPTRSSHAPDKNAVTNPYLHRPCRKAEESRDERSDCDEDAEEEYEHGHDVDEKDDERQRQDGKEDETREPSGVSAVADARERDIRRRHVTPETGPPRQPEPLA